MRDYAKFSFTASNLLHRAPGLEKSFIQMLATKTKSRQVIFLKKE